MAFKKNLVTAVTAGLGAAVKYGLKTLKSGVNLYRSFAKNTAGMFKGANHNQLRSVAYKDMIKTHNTRVFNNQLKIDFDNFQKDTGRTLEVINQVNNDSQ